mmetsp:Transcript_25649/g.39461  ORF Transcript_25649/g.39461 Transcript_25649/m.39461 type:complete len:120 (-) Transcript_25649:55-414(-)
MVISAIELFYCLCVLFIQILQVLTIGLEFSKGFFELFNFTSSSKKFGVGVFHLAFKVAGSGCHCFFNGSVYVKGGLAKGIVHISPLHNLHKSKLFLKSLNSALQPVAQRHFLLEPVLVL